jgi:hypothetical protein
VRSTRIWWRSGLQRLPLFLKGYPIQFKFIKSVTDFIKIASYHSNTETTIKYLQNALSGISSNIHHLPRYCKSRSMNKIPKIHSLLQYIERIREMARLISVTPKYLTPLTDTSATMATTFPTMLSIFSRCTDGKSTDFISSRESVFNSILFHQISCHWRQIYA